jgi:hypothetical protein
MMALIESTVCEASVIYRQTIDLTILIIFCNDDRIRILSDSADTKKTKLIQALIFKDLTVFVKGIFCFNHPVLTQRRRHY